jgi:hypothetical protein
MASVGELASWITTAKSGWAREDDVIPIIRSVVNMLCKVEAKRFLLINAATGRPPTLVTRDTVNGPYNGPVGVWRVTRILLRQPVLDYGLYYDYDSEYAEKPYLNTTEPVEINGNWYYPFNFAKAEDALEGGRVPIMFSRNPGATTDRYFMQAYQLPTQITSDRQVLPIPDSYGAHRAYVFPACLALIEAMDHGNYEKAVSYIEGTIRPLVWKVLNKGFDGSRNRVTSRPY